MTTHRIFVEHNPSQEKRDFLGKSLLEFDAQKVGSMNIRVFGAFLRDPEGKISAGGLGTTMWNWVYINWFWVDGELRGQGWGRKVLQAIEQEAVRLGCGSAYLNTFDFQGLGFYQKQGYEIYGELNDFPEGHKNFHLRKKLDRDRGFD